MTVQMEHSPVVDVLYAIDGTILPKDHRFELMREITRCLPWMEAETGVGIHHIRAARTNDGGFLLPRRAKLVVRLPDRRLAAAAELIGRELNVGGSILKVGASVVRSLVPHGTLYAHFVTADTGDEPAFLAEISARLSELGTPCKIVCGMRHAFPAGQRRVLGFSLMLHDLALEHSILLQQVGLGGDRKLGCGIFVPHRSAAAVGTG
jgi:CRISPR-associated protein Cas6